MKNLELNYKNFVSAVSQSGIVVVDCWAPWCGACKQFSPIYESVADRYPEHTFASLDTQAEAELTEALGIAHTPTLMVFRDGVPVFCQPGNYTESGLIDIIEQAKSLDIEKIKQEMAVAKSAGGRVETTTTAHACH
jgi:thioredoxin 1